MKKIFIALLLAFMAGSTWADNKKGDVDKNGKVATADVTTLVNILLGKQKEYDAAAADVNGDGKVSVADLAKLVDLIMREETESGEVSDEPATGPANARKGRP